MPIHGKNKVVAVLQLINKKTGGEFTKSDEKLVNIFATYCSLALNYTKCIEELKREVFNIIFNFFFLLTWFVDFKKKLNEVCLELLPYQINATVLEPEIFIDPQKITIPSGFNELVRVRHAIY